MKQEELVVAPDECVQCLEEKTVCRIFYSGKGISGEIDKGAFCSRHSEEAQRHLKEQGFQVRIEVLEQL